MTLSALIRKRDTGNLATAIPAISATQPKGEAATVARIATVAVATALATAIPAARKDEGAGTVAGIATVAVAKSPTGEAAELLKPNPDPWRFMRCGDCVYFERVDHPHLGHCAKGMSEAIAGLWDTDRRHCEQYQGIQKRSE